MNKHGFTLAEVIVVIALMAVLSIFLVGIFFANSRFYASQSDQIRSDQNSRTIADRMEEYGRVAVSVMATTTGYTTDSDTVVFRIPSLNGTGQVIADTYDVIVFTKDLVNANEFKWVLSPNAASSRPAIDSTLTEKLQSVSFTYDNVNMGLVRNMNYALQIQQSGRYNSSIQLNGGITLRNK